ncbi:MAG TPA: ABC transporter permease [Alphaproteobacteria bacterium]|nr:ABC transporter permease [Alphaproteobacteria bacterium]
MKLPEHVLRWSIRSYLGLFLLYMLFPLGYMMLLAFNDSRIPTHRNFQFTFKWFGAAWEDQRMWDGLNTSVWIAVMVLAISIPLGLGGAIMLTRMQIRARSLAYAILVSPILAPGIVLGISTFIFWSQQIGLRAGAWTAALGQSSFIAAYCMLIFMSRLQRFDPTLEEAALDLGASPRHIFWRITVPYMRPAFLSAASIAFLQSFGDYTTTYFSIGADQTFTIFIANKVRQGVTPAVNAIAFVIVVLTIAAAVAVKLRRGRQPLAEGTEEQVEGAVVIPAPSAPRSS